MHQGGQGAKTSKTLCPKILKQGLSRHKTFCSKMSRPGCQDQRCTKHYTFCPKMLKKGLLRHWIVPQTWICWQQGWHNSGSQSVYGSKQIEQRKHKMLQKSERPVIMLQWNQEVSMFVFFEINVSWISLVQSGGHPNKNSWQYVIMGWMYSVNYH